MAVFITNVPGPPELLSLAGAPIVAIWPVGGLANNVRLGVAAVSYAGRLRYGIHFDEATVPGAAFAQAMREELTRLAGSSQREGYMNNASLQSPPVMAGKVLPDRTKTGRQK